VEYVERLTGLQPWMSLVDEEQGERYYLHPLQIPSRIFDFALQDRPG